jgi:hypothetical protein
MPITKFTASADNTIVNAYYPNSITRAVYANIGAADSLEIFSIYISGSEPQKARLLLDFPIQEISASRTSGNLPSSGSVNFYLKLYNVEHPETLSTNYWISVNPLSSSWDEGFGLDLENYSDKGLSGSSGFGSNWLYRTSSPSALSWSQGGADIIPGYEKTFYFNNGLEDVEVDITNIVEDQIAGVLPSYGLRVNLSGAYENGTNQTTYYTKRFSARSSEYFYKKPSIEARWKSVKNDDRGQFFYKSNNLSDTDNTQNIFFYNRINGALKDLPSNTIPLVKIYNEDNVLLTSSIPSYKVSTGIYSASFFITGAVEQNLKDVWYSGSSEYFTGTVNAFVRTFDDSSTRDEYIFTIKNLKTTYNNSEKPQIKIFSRKKNWSPNIYKIANSELNSLIFNNLYYKIIRIVDNATIVDYGITPIEYTLCSYDKNGNYFDFDMSLLESGYAYGIKLMLLDGDSRVEFKDIFRFKVE